MLKAKKGFVLGMSVAALIVTAGGVHTPAASAAGTTYYVATTGSDANAGTISAPWKTLQHAADVAAAGDTVYVRGGVYNQKLKLTHSGTAGNPITFSNYSAEVATIDGTGLSVSGIEGIVDITDKDYVKINGFEIRNYTTSTSNVMPVGIYVHGSGSFIELTNNKVHDIKNTATPTGSDLLGRDAHGIAVYGTKAPASIHDVTISGNEVYNLVLGSSESVVLNGNVDTFSVLNNIVHDNDNIGIDIIGFEKKSPTEAYDQARNGIVRGNRVYNITSNNNPSYGKKLPNKSYGADGIYVDGGKDTIIEQNYSYNNDIGIEIASEHPGKSTSNITVRSNMVYKNSASGISLGGSSSGNGSADNNKVVNNTLYKNDAANQGSGQVNFQYKTNNNIIKNNIMVASSNNLLIMNDNTQNSGNIVDYNLYFAPGGTSNATWGWKGTEYTGFASYKSGTANDAHSLFIDPLFVNVTTNDFHLQSTSPAINAGSTDTAIIGTQDIDGQARVQGSAVNIGADE
ncbi:choice-of-anchor Q domain-containing protein [Paenibacillus alba]